MRPFDRPLAGVIGSAILMGVRAALAATSTSPRRSTRPRSRPEVCGRLSMPTANDWSGCNCRPAS